VILASRNLTVLNLTCGAVVVEMQEVHEVVVPLVVDEEGVVEV